MAAITIDFGVLFVNLAAADNNSNKQAKTGILKVWPCKFMVTLELCVEKAKRLYKHLETSIVSAVRIFGVYFTFLTDSTGIFL